MQRPRASAVVLFSAALLSGTGLMILGIMISAMGYGWVSGGGIAAAGFVGAPSAAVAWSVRDRWTGRLLAGLLVFVNALLDFGALYATLTVEREMVKRAWVAMPFAVILAGVLVVVWQLLPVAALLSGIFSRPRIGELVVKP